MRILFFVNKNKFEKSIRRGITRQYKRGTIPDWRYHNVITLCGKHSYMEGVGATYDPFGCVIRVNLSELLYVDDYIKEICHVIFHEVMHHAISFDTSYHVKCNYEDKVLIGLAKHLGLTNHYHEVKE